jgi:hypothetical protein
VLNERILMNLVKEKCYENFEWIHLALDTDELRVIIITAMKIRVLQKKGNLVKK